MSACSDISPEKVNQILLRWCDPLNSSIREEVVEVLEADSSEAIVCSALNFVEETRVSLIGAYYSEDGTVQSCRAEGSKYIVTIRIRTDIPPDRTGIDPGVFAVDSFLTEEQERQILDDLERELQRSTGAAGTF